ncbi:hypothetical protein [uncultured Desulfuromusa sp.]|uniref:hypothetical protein n=1 Tax=uncultured Desulfuromusa sp. TaxID=219183 RepID=UPI002AA86801|nr:hypothetical protein [uncultured Desulfuromusa sp.]
MYNHFLKNSLLLALLLNVFVLSTSWVYGACEQDASLRVIRLLQKVDQSMAANQPLAAQQLIESFKQKYPMNIIT